jgi:hypothetical protein
MQDNIFRFVNIRPPQRKEPLTGNIDNVDPYGAGRYDTALRQGMREAVEGGGREAVRTLADSYIGEHGLISSLERLGTPLAKFDQVIAALGKDADIDAISKAVWKVFDAKPKDLIARDNYITDRQNLADSITAAFFASSLPISGLSHLIRGLRLCELIERIVNADRDIFLEGGVARALRATVMIPLEEEFVQPKADNSVPVPQPLYRLSGGVANRFYTTSTFWRETAIRDFGYVYDHIACYVYTQPVPGTIPLYQLHSPADNLYTTSTTERDAATKRDPAYKLDGVACYVYSKQVPGTTPLYRLVSTVDHFYTTSATERDNAIEIYSYASEGIECYVFPIAITAGAIKPAGVSDLLIVRQTLRRYERGEIAHVENALKGEYKERTHRNTETTETLLLQETETTNEQEHDLQSTERFELKSEASKTVHEDMQTQAGLTVTGSYGTVTATVTGQFAFERSIEEATRTASSYARDVVERTRSHVQERTLERRSTRKVLEVEETAKHGLDNTKEGADHIVGVYRWLDKIYEAQIVNYGKRLMLEFYVPEPAAYHRVLEAGQRLNGLTKKKPDKPAITQGGIVTDLRPELITWPEIQKLAATYETSGIEPPPPPVVVIGTSIEIAHGDKDFEKIAPVQAAFGDDPVRWLPALGGTKTSGELKIPQGYVANRAEWTGQHQPYVRTVNNSAGMLEAPTWITIGSVTGGLNGSASFFQADPGGDGFTDTLPVAVISASAGVVVSFRVVCYRTAALFPKWQEKTYEAIMTAYRDQLQQYEEEVSRLNAERGIQISGRPSTENRKIEQIELKRAAISMLTGQHFDAFGAITDPQSKDESKSPKIVFDIATVEGDLVRYFEQIFEWHNMTYLFYPYFWGRKSNWPDVLSQESTDPLFTHFLKAGYARVQVPVRPNYEKIVLYFLTSSKIWQEAEDAPVAEPYLPLVDEIRNQTGDDFTIGKGTLDIQKNEAKVTGNGTQFTNDDVDREIRVQSKVYRIASFQSATAITLAKPFTGDSDPNAAYSLGPKLVGPSWEVRLPTTLVMIDKPDVVLPEWPED